MQWKRLRGILNGKVRRIDGGRQAGQVNELSLRVDSDAAVEGEALFFASAEIGGIFVVILMLKSWYRSWLRRYLNGARFCQLGIVNRIARTIGTAGFVEGFEIGGKIG